MNKTSNTTLPSPNGKALARFVSNLSPQPNGCLLWTGARLTSLSGQKTYGVINDGGKQKLLYRFALELYTQTSLPSNTYCLHSCDVPNCVAPGHIRAGNAAENSADMVKRGRSMKGKPQKTKRFSTEEKAEIVRLHDAGVSQYQIAKRFGRAESTISNVLKPRKPAPKPLTPAPAAVASEPIDSGKRRTVNQCVRLGQQIARERDLTDKKAT